jgi:hypothetical protein
MGGPAGAIRGYEVGASKATVRTTGGSQFDALLFRRWRLCSGAECLCSVREVYPDTLTGEPYRVATLTVTEATARTTMIAEQYLRHRPSRLVHRSISDFQNHLRSTIQN